jgi:3-hydroxyacyl-[acyl-carrier-protein] dehydratase
MPDSPRWTRHRGVQRPAVAHDWEAGLPSRYNSLLPTMPADSPNPETKQVLEITDIMAILPHRYPFLLIDRVIERERMKRIVAIKNVTMNEPFFVGHFPGYPIMPGVLVVEAMAQAGGLLLLPEVPDRENKLMVFTGIERAKFRKPVVPGDQLRIEVEVMNWRVSAARLEGKAFVDGKLACEAVILCAVVPRVPPTANRIPEQAPPVPPAGTEAPVESAVLEAVVPE